MSRQGGFEENTAPGYLKMDPQIAALVLLGTQVQMQSLRLHSRTTESKIHIWWDSR